MRETAATWSLSFLGLTSKRELPDRIAVSADEFFSNSNVPSASKKLKQEIGSESSYDEVPKSTLDSKKVASSPSTKAATRL